MKIVNYTIAAILIAASTTASAKHPDVCRGMGTVVDTSIDMYVRGVRGDDFKNAVLDEVHQHPVIYSEKSDFSNDPVKWRDVIVSVIREMDYNMVRALSVTGYNTFAYEHCVNS